MTHFSRQSRNSSRITGHEEIIKAFIAGEIIRFDKNLIPFVEPGSPLIIPDSIGGVVSDLDGTLINSEKAFLQGVFAAVENLVSTYSQDASFCLSNDEKDDIEKNCMGVADNLMCANVYDWLKRRPWADRLGRLIEQSKEEFVLEFIEARCELFKSNRTLTPMPGAIEVAIELFDRFGPTSINTGSSDGFASVSLDLILDKELRKRGLSSDLVFPPHLRIYSNTLPNKMDSKPHPHGYQLGSEKLVISRGLEALDGLNNILVLGDRESDVKAGLTSGCRLYIAVPERKDGDISDSISLKQAAENLRPFLGDGSKPNVFLSTCERMPDESPKRDPSRLVIVKSLKHVRFETAMLSFCDCAMPSGFHHEVGALIGVPVVG